MPLQLQTLSAADLRALMLSEAKRFVRALEKGATSHELEVIRTHMKIIGDVLVTKEKEESKRK